MPDTTLISIIPQLSIGVVAIVALVYVARTFLLHLRAREETHEIELGKREDGLRALEKEVRTSVMDQLSKNTRAFERVMDHFNKSNQ